jgi:hypothetical protein
VAIDRECEEAAFVMESLETTHFVGEVGVHFYLTEF